VTVAIAAAGTGGHVFPALAVAEALVERGIPRSSLLFLGGDRIEATAVPDAGFRFVGFELTKLRRQLTLENLRIPAVVRRAGAAMGEEVLRTGSTVVLGMSGYVTVPAALAARRTGLPFVVHEQNAQPTLAARFGARRAVATLLGLPGKSEGLPRSTVVGNPLRKALARFDRASLRGEARRRYGLPAQGAVLGILGGSLGAQVLNAASPSLARVPGVSGMLHLTGREGHGVPSAGGSSLPWIRVAFETEMEYFYAAVDLVVCRAGAMTVSELAATATPSVLVPLERVGQLGNARVLGDAGGARLLRQRDIGRLPDFVGSLISDERGLAALAKGARSAALPDAAGTVAERVLEVAGG
jgi:UDP-N-acetylglucosamine--N-acetylmuramyl-(pentapeptide) pyrophosphoryl-undecaprenol N-acetylglucosamine transferase